ncbi:MAG TPA: cytochrome c peroxidase [Burkholderiales bacterium]|nr:cytochrome c peroxidase [Burkholderiales bacterium]
MRSAAAIALFALAHVAQAQAPFSAPEKARLLTHGPWPPKRVLQKPQTIALGERLFYEPRLSGTGSLLCASCHEPFRYFQDARERGFGLERLERNTPTLVNVGFYSRYGWDGAHDTLWSQSIRPLLEPREMRSSPSHVAALIRARYAPDFERAFGMPVPRDDGEVLADVGKALAAFQETLVSGRTPFDEFRDALARGDATAAARYPLDAQRGAALFVGKAACSGCHAGAQFTASQDAGGFRVPGLRNVDLTAPYMHDGSLATLEDVVRHHGAVKLTPRERGDLVAFLRSLSEKGF